MWFLVFVCVWTAGGVPVNQTEEAVTSTPVGGISLNDTQNVTSSAPGSVLVTFTSTHGIDAEVTAELEDSLVADEGDILIPEERNAMKNLWPDATVPFIIQQEVDDRKSTILEAFKMISIATCIRFVPRTTEFNYVKIKDGKVCASFVGCQGGGQPVFFAKICSVGNLCHEIIHALGLHHEHTRKDRDQYITVKWDNILPGKEKNFKTKGGDTLDLPYDLKSIMHYGEFYFSKDGSPTMLPKNGDAEMGQRKHLSKLDIQRLNKLYRCEERERGN